MEKSKSTEMVKLKTKALKGRKSKEQKVSIGQANIMLKMRKSQWELADKSFKWNGTEIAKA